MRGFTDSTKPVWLHVSQTFQTALGATGPFQIDGGSAERETDGLLVTVGVTRYFVPTQHVVMVTQEQTPATPAEQPTTNPGQGNGGQGGRGGDNAAPPSSR